MAKKRRTRPPIASEKPAPANERTTAASALEGIKIWAILFCATLVAYWPALHGSLIWDDIGHITRPDLQSLHGLWRIWSEPGATQQYYPFLHTAFWLEHQFWGDSVTGYHLMNIALHAGSAALVVLIARRLSLAGAWLAGFIFALHPVYVEGVAWIAEQKSTLSGLFCLAAALQYLHFDERRRASLYWFATGLFALALLSKSVTAMLPVALLIVFWWQLGRLEFRRHVLPLLPWLAMGASMGLFTAWVERNLIGAKGAVFELTPVQHLLLAGRDIWFYASKLVWPVDLTFSYPRWTIDPAAAWQYLYPAGVVALGLALVWLAPRMRGPLASFLSFVVMLFPVLGFLHALPFRYSWVADHFQYLASLALVIPAASLLSGAAGRFRPRQAVGIAIPGALTVALAVLTWQQTRMYRDDVTLYRETLTRNPDSSLAHNNLGKILLETPDRLPEATREFEAAVRIDPDFPEIHFNLGVALTHSQLRDQVEKGVVELQTATRMKPDMVEAYFYLGDAFSRLPGRLPEAIDTYRTALKLQPDSEALHTDLGNLLMQTPGRLPEAVAEFEAAVKLAPNSAETHANLGNALAQMPDRLPDALAELNAALRIQPDLAAVHYNLGSVLTEMPDRVPDAISEFKAALRIQPDFQAARDALDELHAPH